MDSLKSIDLESRSEEISQNAAQGDKEMGNMKQRLRDMKYWRKSFKYI